MSKKLLFIARLYKSNLIIDRINLWVKNIRQIRHQKCTPKKNKNEFILGLDNFKRKISNIYLSKIDELEKDIKFWMNWKNERLKKRKF